MIKYLVSFEGKSLVLVGKWLKIREAEGRFLHYWSTDVTKLKDRRLAGLREVFTGASGMTNNLTDFGTRRIGCCTFNEENWKVIMDARKMYSKNKKKSVK